MEVLIITLLIANIVVMVAAAAVVVGEINKGNKKIQELANVTNCSVIQQRTYNNNLLEAKEEIAADIQRLGIKHDMTLEDTKKAVRDEVPKGLFKFMYPAIRIIPERYEDEDGDR